MVYFSGISTYLLVEVALQRNESTHRHVNVNVLVLRATLNMYCFFLVFIFSCCSLSFTLFVLYCFVAMFALPLV